MLKAKTVIEVKVNDRTYQLECYSDSPLGEVYDALVSMRAFIINMMVEQQKKEETDNKPFEKQD